MIYYSFLSALDVSRMLYSFYTFQIYIVTSENDQRLRNTFQVSVLPQRI